MKIEKRNIFKIAAIAGVGVTAYLTYRRSSKIKEAVEEVKESMPEEKKTVHLVKAAPKMIKASWPVILSGSGTVASILIMDRISYKQIAALTASCAYLVKNRDYLANKLKEIAGNEKFKEIQEAFVKENSKIVYVDAQETGNGNLLCVDAYLGTRFLSSREAVEEGIAEFNHLLFPDASVEALEMPWKVDEIPNYANWNDLHSFWNLRPTIFGDRFGYVSGDDGWGDGPIEFDLIDVEDFEETGKPALIIMPRVGDEPAEWYMEV